MRFTLRGLSPALALLLPIELPAAPPHRYDHVVIVIEENTSFNEVIGNPDDAPYLNELADNGLSFTQMYSITHPSQPNYLELFAGDDQGVRDDAIPPGYPWSAPNLGAALFAAGATFAGFSEDLPAIGDRDTGGTNDIVDGFLVSLYRRKHNPWTNWQAAFGVDPLPPNQLPAESTRRMVDFPTDFSELPTVSFVIPNEQDNMHDGSTRMADDWLKSHLSDYVEWARTHNSLLIVTFDEDNFRGPNLIPTIVDGAGIIPGTENSTTWTLHNLLRTIAEMYGAEPPGRGALVSRITGAFPGDVPVLKSHFRQGENEYDSCVDTYLRADEPDTSNGASAYIVAAHDVNFAIDGNQPAQILLRFDKLFGTGPGQVPTGAQILSAKLILWTGTDPSHSSADYMAVHRMLKPFGPNDSWNSWNGGIKTDGGEAAVDPTFTHRPSVLNAPAIFDVTADVTAWIGGAANRGWMIQTDSIDGWLAWSSKYPVEAQRPALEIAYTVPIAAGYPTWQLSQFGAAAGQPGTLANDDPDHDGASNLLEYVTNSHPNRPAPLHPPLLGRVAQGTTFSFSRNLDAVDVTLRVEAKNNPSQANWTALAIHTEQDGWLVGDGISVSDLAGAVKITDGQTPPGTAQRFYRLKVTKP